MSVNEYKPVAGLTIREALQQAKVIARTQGGTTVANINDIIMCVSQKTDISEALDLYYQKLNFKNEIENIKREKQR